MRKTPLAVLLASAAVLVVPTASHAAGTNNTTHCKNDGHKYIFGKTAAKHGTGATLTGTFERFHPCGEDDGYFTTHHKTVTLTLTTATKIKVFSPRSTAYHTVTAAKFPKAFTRNNEQPTYEYAGPNSAVTKMKGHFVS